VDKVLVAFVAVAMILALKSGAFGKLKKHIDEESQNKERELTR
jgi:hypothetical protein